MKTYVTKLLEKPYVKKSGPYVKNLADRCDKIQIFTYGQVAVGFFS